MVAYVGESWIKCDPQAKQGSGDHLAGSADTFQKINKFSLHAWL
jgi:hypothetical protein